ncbi:MAG TPA: RNA pseudouridine synthase [Candidatus Dojkabacteria bacterium]|nr:RNA pseudouridine synthase [Candidatus Dojkabacteria bacterium]HQF36030.1 RNA pseudouridine synthase [Candidatus Dojkabacteria bacterium]
MEIKVLKITDDFIFVTKPFGLPSTFKNDYDNSDCAVKQVVDIYPELKSVMGYREREGGLLYRLDNDTGGLLVFCRNNNIFNNYKRLQEYGKLYKKYVAVVETRADSNYQGFVVDFSEKSLDEVFIDKSYSQFNLFDKFVNFGSNEFYRINFKIIHSRKTKRRMEVVKSRRDSKYITYFTFSGKKNNYMFLEIYIQRGIRHQIRVHLASIGLHIVNDKLYGKSNIIDVNYMGLFCTGMYIRR